MCDFLLATACGDCGALKEGILVWLTGIRDFLHADESELLIR